MTPTVERSDLERMVAAVEPTWSVERVRPSDEGSAAVHFLTVDTPDGSRDVVVKAFTGGVVSPAVARAEPRLLERLAAETAIPVPEVVGYVDDHPTLPAPFFVAERLPGENGANRFDDLSTAALERVFAQAGRHLAELHSVRPSFERFGRVGVDGGELAVVDDGLGGTDRWSDWLLADAEDTLSGLEGSRFDDLVPALREYVRETVPEIDDPDAPALVHWDYRLGNLLLEPETGRTTAVLDWVDLVAGDPVYNLATVADHNINWQTQDVVRRRRLRNAFFTAYRAHGDDRPADFRERKRVYHLCHRLNAMACLPDWYANAAEAVRDERAAVHRAFVREYLE
ncbi:phosphotransferase family protein [Halopiger thermotolerans]